jgi:DnaJ-class molecular chaperone
MNWYRHVYDTYGEDVLERYERGERQIQRGPNSKLEVQVTLEDLYLGVNKQMTISRDVVCAKCKGTGAKDGKVKKCNQCHGQGMVIQNVQVGVGMTMKMQQPCPKCGGQGVMSAHKCEKCNGNKVHPESKTLQLTIEPGMQNKEKVIFERDGAQQPNVIPGDVIMILKQKKHKKYNRVGNNLYTNMKITLEDALFGFTKTLKSLDGREITVSADASEDIQPFSWKIIKGEGMPLKDNPTEKGDLHVKLMVKMPAKLSEEQKKMVREIFKEETE